MDRLALESGLPQELVSIIMEYKPRDRDAKSSTAALINEKISGCTWLGKKWIWIDWKRRYEATELPDCEWPFYLHEGSQRFEEINNFLIEYHRVKMEEALERVRILERKRDLKNKRR